MRTDSPSDSPSPPPTTAASDVLAPAAASSEPPVPAPDDSAPWPIIAGERFDPDAVIRFTPVPRRRARRRGWSAERQMLFIFILARCGSVARSAKAVGMTPRSAYQLLDAPGADGFAAAWDKAIEEGIERVRIDALERALGGAFVPVFRRGKLVRVEHRHSDAMAVALLRCNEHPVDLYRRNAVSRREHRMELAIRDAERADEAARAAAVRADHQAVLDRLEAERTAPRRRAPPRITRL